MSEKMPDQFTRNEIEILFIVDNTQTQKKEYFLMTGRVVMNDRVQFTAASAKAKTALRLLMQNLSNSKSA